MEQNTQTPTYSTELFEKLRSWLTDNNYPCNCDPYDGIFLFMSLGDSPKILPVQIIVSHTTFTISTFYNLRIDIHEQDRIDKAARFVNYLNVENHGGRFWLNSKKGGIHYGVKCNCTDGFPSDEVMEDLLWQGRELFDTVDSMLQRVILEDLTDEELEKYCGYPLPWYRVLWNNLTAKKEKQE